MGSNKAVERKQELCEFGEETLMHLFFGLTWPALFGFELPAFSIFGAEYLNSCPIHSISRT